MSGRKFAGLEHLKWRQGDRRPLAWFRVSDADILVAMSVEFGLGMAAVFCSLVMRDRRRRNLPLPPWFLLTHALVGLLVCGVALFIGTGAIRAYVWHKDNWIAGGPWPNLVIGLLFAALVAWAGIHLVWQAFQQRRGLLLGSEHHTVKPFVEEFSMNYSAFVRAFVAVNLVFCAVACLWIPVWSGRGKSVFAASLICFLPWLLIAFRMSAGQVRAFFGVSFFVVLLMIPLTDVADHQHFRAIVAAGLLGGLVMLRAAWMRKLGPAETLVDAPISACEEGLIWDGKAFLLALLASVMAVIIVAQLQFSGRPGEIFADLSGDFVLLSVMIMVMTAVFMAMRAWKPRVSAAQLFLSIGALQLFLVWPLLSNPLEGQLPPVVQVSAYAAGLAAGFALIKFGKIRKKQ